MNQASPVDDSSTEQGWAENGAIRLRWERFESGNAKERLLLVNGLSSPMVAYDVGFIAELNQRGFDVVRFDNRDAGRSSATEGGYLLTDMAADAFAVMDAVNWSSAHVFGMSMGGMIVQQMGIDNSTRLQSIVSVMSNTGNPDYGQPSKEAMEALLTPSPTEREAWLDHRVSVDKIWATPEGWTAERSRAVGEAMFDYGVQPAQTNHQFTAIMQSGRRDDKLAKVTTPTLVLHGDKDTLIQPSGGEHTASVMPNATHHVLSGMGHDLPPSYWDRIADQLASFVAAIP